MARSTGTEEAIDGARPRVPFYVKQLSSAMKKDLVGRFLLIESNGDCPRSSFVADADVQKECFL